MKETKEIRSQQFPKPFHEGIVGEAQWKGKKKTGGHEGDTYPPHADSSAGLRVKHRLKPLRVHRESQPETIGERVLFSRRKISTKASRGQLSES